MKRLSFGLLFLALLAAGFVIAGAAMSERGGARSSDPPETYFRALYQKESNRTIYWLILNRVPTDPPTVESGIWFTFSQPGQQELPKMPLRDEMVEVDTWVGGPPISSDHRVAIDLDNKSLQVDGRSLDDGDVMGTELRWTALRSLLVADRPSFRKGGVEFRPTRVQLAEIHRFLEDASAFSGRMAPAEEPPAATKDLKRLP